MLTCHLHQREKLMFFTCFSQVVPDDARVHRAYQKSGAFGFRDKCSGARPPRGFTLLELLVVMVIIGLLVGYVGPRFFAQVGKSEVKAARAQLSAFEKALDQYRLDTGHYPTSEQGLAALMARPGNEPKWDGPYLKKSVPPDPWGKPYLYRSPGERGEYDLVSYGNDGQPGGSGEAGDINNWQ
jgi:general secretion pathway protein G